MSMPVIFILHNLHALSQQFGPMLGNFPELCT
jgi:hypothetical protein